MKENPALLPGEVVILSSQDDSLVLTNFRVKHEVANGSRTTYTSISLEKISACSCNTQTFPLFLLAGAALALGIAFAPSSSIQLALGLAAAICAALYFGTQRGRIKISSDGGLNINVPTKGLSHDQVRKFLEAVTSQQISSLNRLNAGIVSAQTSARIQTTSATL